jgi:hypothetical protein
VSIVIASVERRPGAGLPVVVLLTPEEVDAATKKTVGYRAPGA